MNCDLIITILGPDRQGLVNQLAQTVADHGGNWLESRMARLAGQFAGIARIQCPEDQVDGLEAALNKAGINIQIARESSTESLTKRTVRIEVMGNDRPGIVRELTTAISEAGGNVEEFSTGLESAPMSGHPMFRAQGTVAVGMDDSLDALQSAIEQLGEDLTVDLQVGSKA
ncbi:MAG: ACT domain-containing protein [Akkermansiaceae bacterium]|nr:ACT domain-containing protein [Akkermansiaceae bacterium]